MTPSMTVTDRKNISQVIAAFSNRLFGFIRKRVNTDEDAEDILQDVWYQFTTVVDAEPIEQASAWLFRVARNRITDKHRKMKPDSFDPVFPFSDNDEPNFKEFLLADRNDPETEHLRSLFWEELNAALNELPEDQRQVFIWNELEDISFKEISERTGENVNTLLSRKRYAVLHLRDRLQIVYDELINQ
jgi:RNA polymerase sigma factor (sigma-70 family)